MSLVQILNQGDLFTEIFSFKSVLFYTGYCCIQYNTPFPEYNNTYLFGTVFCACKS